MSLAHEDWKEFDLLSGQLKIADASGSGDVICNAQNGGWVVMCEYDDSNQICYVAGMRDFMAKGMAGGRVSAPKGSTAEPGFCAAYFAASFRMRSCDSRTCCVTCSASVPS